MSTPLFVLTNHQEPNYASIPQKAYDYLSGLETDDGSDPFVFWLLDWKDEVMIGRCSFSHEEIMAKVTEATGYRALHVGRDASMRFKLDVPMRHPLFYWTFETNR